MLISLAKAAGVVAGALMAVLAAAQAQESSGSAEAEFIDTDGTVIGWAKLTEMPNGVLIAGYLTDLPSGAHGFHIHETGRCSVTDGFQAAGGHFSPRSHGHGFAKDGGPHAGDMPNQFVQADGTLRFEVYNPRVSLASGEAPILDADGSALIIHANADDYASQPSGNAGSRVACAVINRP